MIYETAFCLPVQRMSVRVAGRWRGRGAGALGGMVSWLKNDKLLRRSQALLSARLGQQQ